MTFSRPAVQGLSGVTPARRVSFAPSVGSATQGANRIASAHSTFAMDTSSSEIDQIKDKLMTAFPGLPGISIVDGVDNGREKFTVGLSQISPGDPFYKLQWTKNDLNRYLFRALSSVLESGGRVMELSYENIYRFIPENIDADLKGVCEKAKILLNKSIDMTVRVGGDLGKLELLETLTQRLITTQPLDASLIKSVTEEFDRIRTTGSAAVAGRSYGSA